MKITCVSLNCPFIWYCKNYSLEKDHTNGCGTHGKLMEAALRLHKKNRAEAKAIQEAQKNTHILP